MTVNILLVEDDEEKRRALMSFVRNKIKHVKITSKKSVREGFIEVGKKQYALILLDMSLPTYDQTSKSPGGLPQPVGGIEILRLLLRKGRSDKVVIVTQYPELEVKGISYEFAEGIAKIQEIYGRHMLGGVLYSPNNTNWHDPCGKLMEGIVASTNS